MKPILVALVVAFSYVQQGSTDEQYSGQAQHAHPPDSFFCRDKPQPGEHECHCKRMTGDDDPLCENEPDVRECSVFCFAKRHFVPNDKARVDPITGQRGTWHPSHCNCPVKRSDGQGREVICGTPHN